MISISEPNQRQRPGSCLESLASVYQSDKGLTLLYFAKRRIGEGFGQIRSSPTKSFTYEKQPLKAS
jgi:hypothetical protein